MPTRNINLTDHLDRFIEAGVTSGRFSSASEVVREGLRLLETREQEDQARLEWLRAAVREAGDFIARGEGVNFDSMPSRYSRDIAGCAGRAVSKSSGFFRTSANCGFVCPNVLRWGWTDSGPYAVPPKAE